MILDWKHRSIRCLENNQILTGEREGLKQLGIVLKQTTVDESFDNDKQVSSPELTELRAQATLTFYPRTFIRCLGDLDRTSDGFANTQRRLKAELRETATSMGNVLMPSVNELFQ